MVPLRDSRATVAVAMTQHDVWPRTQSRPGEVSRTMTVADQWTRAELLSRPPADDPVSHAVTIVIPAYNEEHAIVPVVERIRDAMEDFPFAFEILIVDDGS